MSGISSKVSANSESNMLVIENLTEGKSDASNAMSNGNLTETDSSISPSKNPTEEIPLLNLSAASVEEQPDST